MPIADFNMEIRYKIVSINFFMIDSQKLICFKPASIHQLIVFYSHRMQTVSFFMLMLTLFGNVAFSLNARLSNGVSSSRQL